MSDVKVNRVKLVGFTAGIIVMCSPAALARDKDPRDYFADCPVANDIRVSDIQSTNRFASLNACTARIVYTEASVLPADPGVARIMGVADKDETPKERRERERATRDAAATSRTSYRVPLSAYDAHVFRTAAAHRVDPLFLHAIIATESAHNPRAVSRVGARGLMQIMPGTGRTLGVQEVALFDPAINVDAGARLLKRLQKRYGRNFDLILSAYNAGEGAVAKYGNRIPPYRETQNYVAKVMARYKGYRLAGYAR